MKTWKATLLQLALAIAAAFVPAIKDPNLQKAAGTALLGATALVSHVNGNSDQEGNPLPPVPKDR